MPNLLQGSSSLGYIDDITINQREFDELPRDIEFFPEDLKDERVILEGILESENDAISVETLSVEISTDGGKNWSKVVGHGEWKWSFVPEIGKRYCLSFRVVSSRDERKIKSKITKSNPSALKLKKFKKDISIDHKNISNSQTYTQIEKTFFKTTTKLLKVKLKKPIVYTALTKELKVKLIKPIVYAAVTKKLRVKLKKPIVYTAATKELKVKLKKPMVYIAVTKKLRVKLIKPIVYEATTKSLKLKLK